MAFVRDLDNLIPIMSSNTAPSGYVVSASSELSTIREAWHAFNGSLTSSDSIDCWATNSTATGWLRIQFPIAKIVNKYIIYGQNGNQTRSPKTWTLEGSQNGTSWTILDDTQTSITGWADGVAKTFIFSNSTAYLYYQINIRENNEDSILCIGELELCATGQYASLIPPMTSNTAPSGVASASGYRGAGWEAYKALNGIADNLNSGTGFMGNTTTGWIQYQFPVAKTVCLYSILNRSDSADTPPVNFTFLGSNNGTDWATLDTRSGVTWALGMANTFAITSPVSYTYYRLNCTANNGNGTYWGLDELRLFGYGDPVNRWMLTSDANDSAHDGTVSLLHFDGNLTDESGKTWTAYGGAATSTAQSKSGGNSLYLDGTNDYITTPDSTDWSFGAGDFTIDFWVYCTRNQASQGIIGQWGDASPDSQRPWLITVSGTTLNFAINQSAYNVTDSGFTLNEWNHVAITRYGNVFTIYRNGTSVATVTQSVTFNESACPVTIGRVYSDYDGVYFQGYIDELRISKGIARWTSNFTPPTSAYTTTNPGPVLNLTNNGGVTFSADGASFNGSNQWLSGTKAVDSVITMFMWVKFKSKTSVMCPFAMDSSSADKGRGFYYSSGTLSYIKSGHPQLVTLGAEWTDTNFPSNSFVNIIMTYDGTNIKYYRDGTEITGTQSGTFATPSTSLSIGRMGAYSGDWFANIDAKDARIYDYPLTASEVATLYAAGPNPSATPSGSHPMPIVFFF